MEFQWWKWGSVTLLFKRNVKQFMKSLSLTVCCCCSVLLVVKRPLCYMHFLKSVSEATSVVFALKVGGEVTMVLTFRIYRRESLSCTGVMTSYILNVLESDYDNSQKKFWRRSVENHQEIVSNPDIDVYMFHEGN